MDEERTWRDGAAPLLALVLAWLFWECFDPVRMGDFGFPHLGVLVLVCAHFAAVFLTLGKGAHITAGGLICMAAALGLGLSCALYDSEVFLLLNCFVILLTAALGTFSLAGRLNCGRPRAIWDAVSLSFAAFFTRLDRPFRALGRACRGDKRRVVTAALAVLMALPVLGVALWLLTSADAVFSSLFARLDLSDLPEVSSCGPSGCWSWPCSSARPCTSSGRTHPRRKAPRRHLGRKPGPPCCFCR